jgi:imidazolonepropionase-like amidohydrolase
VNKFIRLNFYFSLLLAASLIFICAFNSPTNAQTGETKNKTYRFTGGNWFDGKSFKRKNFYSVNGFFTHKRPKQIDETIDLKNGYVVPPFADSHCHHFDGAYNVRQQIAMYLKDGVFYAKVQTDVRSGALQVADKVNRPTSVDVSYSHGALTSTAGHGVEVYEGLPLFYKTGGFTPEEERRVRAAHLRENDAYYIIDDAADLENKWAKILAGKPDFIKFYLLESENYAEKKKNLDKIRVGSIGLDPQIVPAIVERAHAAGLRVSAHVDTVTDYRIALRAGVDEMAHLVGYYIQPDDDPRKYELTAEDVKEMARRRVSISVNNVAVSEFNAQSPYYNPKVKAVTDRVRIENLRLIKKYWVKINFGSDRYGSTPLEDVLYLQKQNVFTNLEMLKIWCEDTPANIFPNRRIGFLKEGYEASFLVLGSNPLTDFASVKNILLRFKQGFQLDSARLN